MVSAFVAYLFQSHWGQVLALLFIVGLALFVFALVGFFGNVLSGR